MSVDEHPDGGGGGRVRSARARDAADLARIQVTCWRCGYRDVVPERVLAEITSPQAEARWRDRWAEAITKPPTSRHRVLVAVTSPPPASEDPTGAAAATGMSRVVAGFAAIGPATDTDRWPGTDAELFELRVAPEWTGRGHGSQLLRTVVDTLVEDRFTTVTAWTLEADTALRRLLESAGWGPDGARAELDMGVRVPIIRLHAPLLAARG